MKPGSVLVDIAIVRAGPAVGAAHGLASVPTSEAVNLR
jgi:hypothetical protein